jgi:two-component sensor histidine kinase
MLRAALDSRLLALASAHDVLTRESWQGANLHDVISTALAPFRGRDDSGRDDTRFTISGPALRLQPRAALSLSMALHELATNALKFGALAVAGGHVALHWDIEETDTLRFRLIWSETGVRLPSETSHRGFGSKLIEHVVARDLAAKINLDFAATGVVCTVDALVSEIVPAEEMMEFPHVGRTPQVGRTGAA